MAAEGRELLGRQQMGLVGIRLDAEQAPWRFAGGQLCQQGKRGPGGVDPHMKAPGGPEGSRQGLRARAQHRVQSLVRRHPPDLGSVSIVLKELPCPGAPAALEDPDATQVHPEVRQGGACRGREVGPNIGSETHPTRGTGVAHRRQLVTPQRLGSAAAERGHGRPPIVGDDVVCSAREPEYGRTSCHQNMRLFLPMISVKQTRSNGGSMERARVVNPARPLRGVNLGYRTPFDPLKLAFILSPIES